jgi:hypothetical protein
MKGLFKHRQQALSWKKRTLEKWIRFSGEFDASLDKYRFNALLGVLLIWGWFLLTLAISNAHRNPFASAIAMYKDRLPHFIGWCAVYWVGCCIMKMQKKQRVKKFAKIPLPPDLALWWLLVVGCTWLTLFPDELGVNPALIHGDLNEWGKIVQVDPGNGALWEQIWIRAVVYMSALYTWHLPLCAIWYTICSLHTLVFIMRNRRAKLSWWWGLQLAGFPILSLLYAVSPVMASFAAITVPQEVMNRWLKAGSEKDQTLRGAEMVTPQKARRDYRRDLDVESRLNRTVFPFGSVLIPLIQAVTHVLALGSSGSGKTLTLLGIMKAALPLVIPAGLEKRRAIVLDQQQVHYSLVQGIDDLSADIKIINPFDRRGVSWAIAVDFTDMTGAQTAAATLVPEPKSNQHSDAFFHSASVGAVTAVLMTFIDNAPGNWRLADVVRAFGSLQTMSAVIASNEQAQMYLNTLGSDKTSQNILSSVCVEIYKYAPLAALWEHATESVSITEWMQGGQIWILGNNPKAPETIAALQRCLLKRMSQFLLGEANSAELQPRTFLFMDEIQSVHFDDLQALLERGRQKGICFVGAFQSIQAMVKQYGKETTDAMLGQIRHKAFLKLSDDVTAEWASRQFGDAELLRSQPTTSFQTGAEGLIAWSDRTGGGKVIQQTRRVLPSEIMHLPAINPARNQGITGFYQANNQLYKDYVPWNVLEKGLIKPSEFVENFEAAPDRWQKLAPWTEDDWERLGIAQTMRRVAEFTNPNNSFSSDGGRNHHV